MNNPNLIDSPGKERLGRKEVFECSGSRRNGEEILHQISSVIESIRVLWYNWHIKNIAGKLLITVYVF